LKHQLEVNYLGGDDSINGYTKGNYCTYYFEMSLLENEDSYEPHVEILKRKYQQSNSRKDAKEHHLGNG